MHFSPDLLYRGRATGKELNTFWRPFPIAYSWGNLPQQQNFNGAPLPWPAILPRRDGVHTLALDKMSPPWIHSSGSLGWTSIQYLASYTSKRIMASWKAWKVCQICTTLYPLPRILSYDVVRLSTVKSHHWSCAIKCTHLVIVRNLSTHWRVPEPRALGKLKIITPRYW